MKISEKRQNPNFGPPELKNRVPQGQKTPILAGIRGKYTPGSIFIQIGVVEFPVSLILRENDS